MNETTRLPILIVTETPEKEREPPFDESLLGALAAVFVFALLYGGFLYSWFTMGR